MEAITYGKVPEDVAQQVLDLYWSFVPVKEICRRAHIGDPVLYAILDLNGGTRKDAMYWYKEVPDRVWARWESVRRMFL